MNNHEGMWFNSELPGFQCPQCGEGVKLEELANVSREKRTGVGLRDTGSSVGTQGTVPSNTAAGTPCRRHQLASLIRIGIGFRAAADEPSPG